MVSSKRVNIEGHLLHRLVIQPRGGIEPVAAAIFYHGQGDYAERYADVLKPFTERGMMCVITELPGHGLSPGQRGDTGDEQILDAIIEDTLKSFGDLPYAVMGHSMGGLLAMRHLVMAGQGRWRIPFMVWVNAPLIQVSTHRSPLFFKCLHFFSSLVPSFTLSTGVSSDMCRVKGESTGAELNVPVRHPLWHRRISLAWGDFLHRSEQLITAEKGLMPADIPLLMTQGGADPVCPSPIAREFFQSLPHHDKTYHEFAGGLHEFYAGDSSDQKNFNEVLNGWLEQKMRTCPWRENRPKS